MLDVRLSSGHWHFTQTMWAKNLTKVLLSVWLSVVYAGEQDGQILRISLYLFVSQLFVHVLPKLKTDVDLSLFLQTF